VLFTADANQYTVTSRQSQIFSALKSVVSSESLLLKQMDWWSREGLSQKTKTLSF